MNRTSEDDLRPRTPDYEDLANGKAALVDQFFVNLLVSESSAMGECLRRNENAGLPRHDVSALQGKHLHLLVRISGARRILEIGTLGGYSTIWMADALEPGGTIDTIEAVKAYAEVARQNIKNAGHDKRVTLHEGLALDVLPRLRGRYDFIFIDADKQNYPAYLQWALKLAQPGTVIVADNVVRGGDVINQLSDDERVIGVRQFMLDLSENPKLSATALQTTGEKGWDGFVIARVRGD